MNNLEENGLGPVQPQVIEPRVSHGNAPIVPTARMDEASLQDLMTYETVLLSGVIKADSPANQKVFSFRVSPRMLSSSVAKSRIAHIAEMYLYWQGEIQFRMIVSKAIFQQTKIVIAFIPTPELTEPKMTADQLVGYQNRIIVNPDNDMEAIIPVPFIADGNWLPMTSSTGWLVARLLQPIVITQNSTSDIPWTLCVAARPGALRFRYLIPPPLTTTAGDPGSVPAWNDGVGDTPISGARQLFGAASSAMIRQQGERVLDAPLVMPRGAQQITMQSAILIPRAAWHNAFQVLAGNFNTGTWDSEFMRMPQDSLYGPALSFRGPSSFTLPTCQDFYPHLHGGAIIAITTNFNGTPNPFILEARYVAANNVVSSVTYTLYVRVWPGAPVPKLGAITPTMSVVLPKEALWYVFPDSRKVLEFSYVGVDTSTSYPRHKWTAGTETPGLPYRQAWARAVMAIGSGGFWWPDTAYSVLRDRVLSMLQETQMVPQNLSHLAVYTDLPREQASNLAAMLLNSSDFTAEFASAHVSFTMMQGPGTYDDGRLMLQDPKTVTWSLYNWSYGDPMNPVGWVFKSPDYLADFVIPAVTTPDGTPAILDIGPGSKSLVLYSRDLLPADFVPTGTTKIVRGFPSSREEDDPNSTQTVETTASGRKRRARRRHRVKRAAKTLGKIALCCGAAALGGALA